MTPAAVETYSGLTRHALRVLTAAQILPPRSELTPADAVIARVARLVYWSGPGISAPGDTSTRDERQRVAARAGREVRALLKKSGTPEAAVITLATGATAPITDAGDIVKHYMAMAASTQQPQPWLCVPLSDWWAEARALRSAGRGTRQTTPA